MYDDVSVINEGLLLSGYRSVKQTRLEKMNVTCVVDASNVLRERALKNVEYYSVPVDDDHYATIDAHFDAVADLIHSHRQKGGKTLVHCLMGVSRSASLCMAYLVKHEKRTLRNAYLHVLDARSVICPNPGFWRQMIAYELRLNGSATVAMKDGVPDVLLFNENIAETDEARSVMKMD